MFAAQWGDALDASFRPFAIAVIELSDTKRVSESTRKAIYRDLCLRRRAEVLADILRKPVAPRVVSALGRTAWQEFARSDWELFFTIALGEGEDSALGHVLRITRTLVRQFTWIPEELRLAGLLNLASSLEVPPERWGQLRRFLQRADPGRRGDLLRAAGILETKGDFWDFYFHCEGQYSRPFTIAKALCESELLEPIGSPQAMEAEGRRMENCLGNRVSRVRGGKRVYFKPRDRTSVNAELVRRRDRWVAGDILGPRNSTVSPETVQRVGTELRRLAALITDESLNFNEDDAYVEQLREVARKSFSAKDIARLTAPLHQIRAKSRSLTEGAYAIFELQSGPYVQLMSSCDGEEYLFEIRSHKYDKDQHTVLTTDVVDLIEKAGFVWPNGTANYLRWFDVSSPEDIEMLAEVALVMLARIFQHRKGRSLKIETRIPD